MDVFVTPHRESKHFGIRYPEIDIIKAVAILAVVAIHSLRPFWENPSRFEQFIGATTRFAVPAFFAVSGFLYYSARPLDCLVIAQRLRRLALPYLCMSLLAFSYQYAIASVHRAYRGHSQATDLISGLLLGSTFGPYYFPIVLAQFVVAAWLLSRTRRAAVCIITCSAGIVMLLAELHIWPPIDLFWTFRLPNRWAVWFLLGWTSAAYNEQVLAFTRRFRIPLILASGAVMISWSVWFLLQPSQNFLLGKAFLVLVMATTIVGLFAFARGVASTPTPVVVLSEWSYPIYLIHPFFSYSVQDILGGRSVIPPLIVAAIAWGAGVGGALALTQLGRRALGKHSRDVLGA